MNNPEIWTEIHRMAEELYMLQPWEYMEETDTFGVRTNLSGKTYFISVMGSGDQIRAISAYEGAPGLYGFWELEDNPSIRPESVLLIPHIMLSFVSKAILDMTQKEILKITGFDKRKLREWPEVQRIIPGLVPAIPDEGILRDCRNPGTGPENLLMG
jgi:hypothetical protein